MLGNNKYNLQSLCGIFYLFHLLSCSCLTNHFTFTYLCIDAFHIDSFINHLLDLQGGGVCCIPLEVPAQTTKFAKVLHGLSFEIYDTNLSLGSWFDSDIGEHERGGNTEYRGPSLLWVGEESIRWPVQGLHAFHLAIKHLHRYLLQGRPVLN